MQPAVAADMWNQETCLTVSFEWREEYSVHISQMDAQHRGLIALLGELRRSVRSGASEKLAAAALREVLRYADWHLRREELVLRVRGYPGYAEHKAEHDAYRKRLVSLQIHAERKDLGIRISNFLTEWWRYHILTSDQDYGRFFRSQPARAMITPS